MPETPPLTLGEKVGKFVVGSLLSRSAVSEVYEARDEAGNPVALKLLRGQDATPGAAQRLRRVQREAETMTRLQHPSVVRVLEFGLHAGRPFLAMEWVEGGTLGQWLADRPRTVREILGPFLEAGRGLAWMHQVGVVHRDFKPDNVLIGADGLARLTDVGLPSPVVAEEKPAEQTPDKPLSEEELEAQQARGPSRSGLPRYLAPEQLSGIPAGPAADQYSFCFALQAAVSAATDADTAAARRVLRVLTRGLASQPGARYPRMEVLLRALGRALEGRVWKTQPRLVLGGAGAAAAIVLVVAVLLVTRSGGGVASSDVCGTDERLAKAWHGRKDRLHDALKTAWGGAQEQKIVELEEALDGAAAKWAELHRRVCEGASPEDQKAEAAADPTLACLEVRLLELTSLVDALEEPDGRHPDLTPRAAQALPTGEDCLDPQVLAAFPRLPTEAPRRVDAKKVRQHLSLARTWARLGQLPRAQKEAEAATQTARPSGDKPALAEALYVEGALAQQAGDAIRSEQLYFDSLEAAQAAGHDEMSAQAALALSRLLTESRPQESERWLRLGAALVERLPRATSWQGQIAVQWSRLTFARGEADKSVEHGLRALQLLPADSPDVWLARTQVATALERSGQADEACRQAQQAFENAQRLYGLSSPYTAQNIAQLGRCALLEGKTAEALPLLDTVLRVQMQTLGSEHIEVARSLAMLGGLHSQLGHKSESIQMLRQSLVIYTRAMEPHSPEPLAVLGRYADALLAAGQKAEALASYNEAVRLIEKQHGPSSPLLADPLTGLGRLQLGQGVNAKAAANLQRALTVGGPGRDPFKKAETQFALARALWAMGGDKVRPVRLATDAAGTLRKGGVGEKKLLESVEAWLNKRQPVIAARR